MESEVEFAVGDSAILFNNEVTVHKYSDHNNVVMNAAPMTRYEDFSDWYRLAGKPEHIWFSKVGDRIVGFDSSTIQSTVLNPYQRKDKPNVMEFQFQSSNFKITLSQVKKLWDTGIEVLELWNKPLRVNEGKPLVKTMSSSLSMVHDGKILSRKQLKKLIDDWNGYDVGFKLIETDVVV